MFKLMAAVFFVSLLFVFTAPVMAQEAAAPTMQAQEEDPGMLMGMEQDPEMAMPGMDGMEGMNCSPGCKCEMCMKKKMGMMGGDMGMMGMGKGKMGMMGMGMKGGMAGMRGDIDMMTWPRMHKSCRLPDYYLMHKDELSLSDEQVDSLEKALLDVKKGTILKGAQVKALELELSVMVKKPDFKLGDALAKLKEIEDARVELRSSMLKASAGARDSLSPEQLKKLKDLTRGGGACCGKCKSKSMEMPMDKSMDKGVPEDMKQKMMEKMQKQMMQ